MEERRRRTAEERILARQVAQRLRKNAESEVVQLAERPRFPDGAETARGIFRVKTSKKYWGKVSDAGFELVPNLGAIRLSANRICNKSMKALAARLPSCIDPLTGLASLQTLDLTDNHIGDEGVGYLAEALPQLPELEELFLQVNRFADVGPLSLALPACSRLKELQLGGNRIACTGALALARALPRCPMLHILGLSGNVIADSGARAIASVLPSCKQLRKLMMKMNAFRETE